MPEQAPAESLLWRKAISPERDRLQSRVLVAVMLPLLTVLCCLRWQAVWQHASTLGERHTALASLGISLTFALVVWLLRSATWLGAVSGGVICELLELASGSDSVLRSGLASLLVLFIATFLATRAGRRRKAALGLAEPKTGRRASQVIANLGLSGIAAFLSSTVVVPVEASQYHTYPVAPAFPLAIGVMLAALCEATADTVSSEVGQAFGGTPRLLTTLRSVPAGTDGAISLKGTAAGIVASALVALAGWWALSIAAPLVLLAYGGGIAGLLFDSLLGATAERDGWLGNDMVNFSSTILAGAFPCVCWGAFVWIRSR